MIAHSAEGPGEGAVAVAVLDSADYSTPHTTQVEVQVVAAVTDPIDSGVVAAAAAVVVAAVASAEAAVAVQLHSDLRFD